MSYGSYGSYKYIGGRKGMKILTKYPFRTKQLLKKSLYYTDALKEFNWLKRLEESGFTPKPYDLVITQEEGMFYAAIIMQHLGKTRLCDMAGGFNKEKILENLYDKLYNNYRIIHNDIHDENVMLYKGKFYLIDFGSDYIEEERE